MGVVEVRGVSYHMDDGLKEKWDKIKDGAVAKYDEDRFYITDGEEGSGKSLFTIQQAAYIDPTVLDDEGDKPMPRICFTAEAFLDAIRHTRSTQTHTKVVIFDEAFRGLSSKAALSRSNKLLIQAIMEARQNNLVVFIVSPSFYMIEFYAAVHRSQALFHVVKQKQSRRRYVRIFGKKDKAKLYQIGIKRGWGYPMYTRFRINFFNKYPGGDEFETKYRQKKRDSLREEDREEKLTHKWKRERDALLQILNEEGYSYDKIITLAKDKEVHFSLGGLSDIVGKFKARPISS